MFFANFVLLIIDYSINIKTSFEIGVDDILIYQLFREDEACNCVSLTLCCFLVYSTRRLVLCLTLCYFVPVFFSPFSIAITSLGEERANLSAFRTFVWFCLFPLPLGVWEGLQCVIMALPGLFCYFFFLFYLTL